MPFIDRVAFCTPTLNNGLERNYSRFADAIVTAGYPHEKNNLIWHSRVDLANNL